MKLGVLGGSFNPFHNGHLHLAQKALEELKLERVVFIPAYLSPFKNEESGMTDNTADRIKMIAAAIAGDPRFAIDDCEIKREGVSYTVDTLEDITQRYCVTGKLFLIIGDDLAADFPKWRESERILDLAEVVVGNRGQGTGDKGQGEDYLFPHIKLNNEILDISSSKIRQLISEGKDYSSFIPAAPEPKVRLRRCVSNIEDVARETLSQARFLHSRHTALLAYDMCNRFGIDPMDGYLAGIAHDLAKQHDPKEMIKLAKKDGNSISSLEKDKPGLLHGRAAAVLIRERFSIHNKDILEAVAVHTMGSENMGQLAKIIYIADKIEVSRNTESLKTLSGMTALRKMCYTADSLDEIFFTVLKKAVGKLKERELDLSEETIKLLEKMNKEKNN